MAVIVTIPNLKPSAFFDQDDFVRVKPLPIRVECVGCQEGVTDECPECANDIQAKNLVTCEGSLFLQFFFTDEFNEDPTDPDDGWLTWLDLTVVTPNGSYPIADMNTIAVSWWVTNVDGQSIQQIEIDMAKMCALIGDEQCFYFQIGICKKQTGCTRIDTKYCGDVQPIQGIPVGTYYFNPGLGQLSLYGVDGWEIVVVEENTCVYCSTSRRLYIFNGDAWVPASLDDQQQTITVCNQNCFTETYRIARCEDVICFQATFTSWDCIGYFYGAPDPDKTVGSMSALNPFEMIVCYEGSIERQAFPSELEKTEDGKKTIKKTMREASRLRLFALSEFQARKLANIFMGETWGINGETWDDNTPVEKNNDISSMWFPDITVSREICEKSSFACDE